MARNLCALLFLLSAGYGQSVALNVRGELLSNTPRLFSEYAVEMVDTTHRGATVRTEVRVDGVFEFRNLPTGEYSLTVTTLQGDPVHHEFVSLGAQTGPMEVRLPDAPPKRPGATAISVKQLLHPPTRKAFQSFVAAQQFSASGDYAKAAESLERAVEQSPDYAEAHVNLGAQYVRLGRYQAAIAEMNRAIEIAGPTSIVLCNLATAQFRMGRREQAIETVRSALRLDSAMPQGHLILGAILANDPRSRQEAIQHLERAAGQFESARKILETISPEKRSSEP